MIDIEAMPFIADIPRVQAERRPDDVALWYKGEETTYRAFATRCNQVANGLLGLGVSPNERIGYLAKNTAVYYEMLCGGAQIRAVMNAVNTRLAPPEIQFILSDAKATVLFVGAEFYEVINGLRDQLPDLHTVIAMDGPYADWPNYAEWRDGQSDAAPAITPLDDDDVIQLYTSGTTGLPKGVMLTNKNYKTFYDLASLLAWSSYDEGESVMNAMPLFHVAGVNVGVLALHQGARTVVLPEIDPTEILRLVEEEKINHAFWVPAVILMLSQHPRFHETDFSSLRFVSYGASPIAEDLLKTAVEVMGAGFTQLYGLTETVGAATYLPPEAHDPAKGKLRSCGLPWPNSTVLCVDENEQVLTTTGSVTTWTISSMPLPTRLSSILVHSHEPPRPVPASSKEPRCSNRWIGTFVREFRARHSCYRRIHHHHGCCWHCCGCQNHHHRCCLRPTTTNRHCQLTRDLLATLPIRLHYSKTNVPW